MAVLPLVERNLDSRPAADEGDDYEMRSPMAVGAQQVERIPPAPAGHLFNLFA